MRTIRMKEHPLPMPIICFFRQLLLHFGNENLEKYKQYYPNIYEPPLGNTNNLHRRKQKGADQLRGNREADQRLCFRYTDSTIPLLLLQNFKPLTIFCDCTARFASDLVGTQIVDFLTHRLISYISLRLHAVERM